MQFLPVELITEIAKYDRNTYYILSCICKRYNKILKKINIKESFTELVLREKDNNDYYWYFRCSILHSVPGKSDLITSKIPKIKIYGYYDIFDITIIYLANRTKFSICTTNNHISIETKIRRFGICAIYIEETGDNVKIKTYGNDNKKEQFEINKKTGESTIVEKEGKLYKYILTMIKEHRRLLTIITEYLLKFNKTAFIANKYIKPIIN